MNVNHTLSSDDWERTRIDLEDKLTAFQRAARAAAMTAVSQCRTTEACVVAWQQAIESAIRVPHQPDLERRARIEHARFFDLVRFDRVLTEQGNGFTCNSPSCTRVLRMMIRRVRLAIVRESMLNSREKSLRAMVPTGCYSMSKCAECQAGCPRTVRLLLLGRLLGNWTLIGFHPNDPRYASETNRNVARSLVADADRINNMTLDDSFFKVLRVRGLRVNDCSCARAFD